MITCFIGNGDHFLLVVHDINYIIYIPRGIICLRVYGLFAWLLTNRILIRSTTDLSTTEITWNYMGDTVGWLG